MSRDFTPSEREDSRELVGGTLGPARASEPRRQEQARNPGRSAHPERAPQASREPERADIRSQDSRAILYDRYRPYRLRPSEIHTLTDLGKFRVIGTEDLANHVNCDDREAMQQELRNLFRQGLVRRGIFDGPNTSPRELLTLTKIGHRLVRANRLVPAGQWTYHGFLKPKEANHDADLYRLYQKEAEKILSRGGTNPRVVLDYELKKKLNRDFAKFGTASRHQIAARHGLRVVNGKVPIPDLRIEYETPEGDMARVDLELATEHYRPRQLAEKVRAGFSLYAPRSEADRLRRVLDQRELTAEILSL
jgi:hypothetical protein